MYTGFVVGLDLSLTSTGIAAVAADGSAFTTVVKSTGSADDDLRAQTARIDSLRQDICTNVTNANPALVVIESALFSTRKDSSAHRRAGLWWIVASSLISAGVPVTAIAPTQVKKYATGKGNASKEQVLLRVASEWGTDVLEDGRNDRADALVLASMGAHALGAELPVSSTGYRDAVVSSAFADLAPLTATVPAN